MTTSRKPRQRTITPAHRTDPALLRAQPLTRLTAHALWMAVDDFGGMTADPLTVMVACYPGEAVPLETIEEHLHELWETGFLTLYTAEGADWLELTHPLMTQRPGETMRPRPVGPKPVPEHSGKFLAVGGGSAGERERAPWEGAGQASGPGAGARERVRREPAGEPRVDWRTWREEAEREVRPPIRPLLLDAPPIGCPEHPHGRFKDCGPCGTARKQHDLWVAQRRHGIAMEDYAEQQHAAHTGPVFVEDEPESSAWADGGEWAADA